MALFGNKKQSNPNILPVDQGRLEAEHQTLASMQRGTVIGDFVTICRTDYSQPYADQWINGYHYTWNEYLLLAQTLLRSPTDLTDLVYLPEDLSEVYLVMVPAQAPDYRYLTPHGRSDYELAPGYEQAVNQSLYRDYAIPAKNSVYHSVDAQSEGWQLVVDQVFAGKVGVIEVEYNGIKYTYNFPSDPDGIAAAAWTAQGLRRGAYPKEESLRSDQKFDLVPAIPDGKSATISVREYTADPGQNPLFQHLSFQRTDVAPQDVADGQPTTTFDISFGNDLPFQTSIIDYLSRQYVQLSHRNPTVRFTKFY